MGRYRLRRVPARTRVVKVLYGDDELGSVQLAAARVGLRPSGYVAAAALARATDGPAPDGSAQDREVLSELMATRTAVRLYGVNLNQIAAAMNSGVSEVPVWLMTAITGAERAVARIDEAAELLHRRLA